MQLAPQWAAFKRAARHEDLFVFVSRGLVYVGMFFLTLLKFKASKGLNVSDAIFLVAAVLLLLSRRPPPRAPATPAWYVGAFIFLLSGVVASTQADSVGGSLLVVVNGVYLLFILQFLLRQQLNNTLRLQRAIGAFVFGTTLSGLVAILQIDFHLFLPVGNLAAGGTIGGNSRAIGLSTQPNLLGVALALGIVFAVGLLFELNKRKHWYLGACVAVMVAALLLSGSVSGEATTILGLLVLFVARGAPLKTVALVALSLAAVYVLVFGVIDRGSHLDPITRIEKTLNSSGGSNTGTFQLRIDTIKTAWSGIVEKPIVGHGLDQKTLAVFFDKYIYVYYPPHNVIILYWFGGGIFMLLSLFIMMGSSFNRLLSGRRMRGENRDPMRAVVFAACVASLFYSLQGPELVDRWMWVPFILAFCFRDPARPPAASASEIELPVSAPDLPAVTAGNGGPRRMRGTVGRHAAPAREPS
ncbi:MAG TPA: O-antigen ligase family protein [Acidimicrobiales bacterium]|nr:O-antigen ligase family protein [Acidimicrobiales bacterium]